MVENKTCPQAVEFALQVQGGDALVTPVLYEAPDLKETHWPIVSSHAIASAGRYMFVFERRDPVIRKDRRTQASRPYLLEIAPGGGMEVEDNGDPRFTAIREFYEEAALGPLGVKPTDVWVTRSEIYFFDHKRRIEHERCLGPLCYGVVAIEMSEDLACHIVENHPGNSEVKRAFLIEKERLLSDPLWEGYDQIIPFQTLHFLEINRKFFG